MHGLKFRDLLIMKQVLLIIDSKSHHTECGRKQIIDLKHGLDSLEGDLAAKNNRLAREDWELRHGFLKNSSKHKTVEALKCVNLTYQNHVLKTTHEMSDRTLLIPGDYISGVIEGDGSFSVTIRTYKNKTVPFFSLRFAVTCELDSELLLSVVSYYLNDDKPLITRLKKSKASVYSAKAAIIPFVLNSLKQYPLLKNINYIRDIYTDVLCNVHNDYTGAENLAKLIYYNQSPPRTRNKSLDEVLIDFKSY
jgi:hypothetical protein